MEGRNLFQIVKDFLLSNMNKQLLVFLFFVLLSAVFWFILTLNGAYEKELKIPVQIVNVPRNVMLTSAHVDTVRATVHDQGWVLLNYLYGEHKHSIKIDFRNYDKENGKGVVPASDLKRAIEQCFEMSSKITSVKPEKLEFFYNNGERKRVPVHWTGRVIPEQLYFISHVDYMPDSVEIYASKEKLDSIRAVYTEALNYVNFRDTLTVDCQLAHINDVKIVPERVRIRFHTDVLTEETISNVPIRCLNLPEGKVLRTFPRYAKVHFVAGVSQIRSLRAEDFLVVADFREIMVSHKEKCNLYLREVPRGVSRAVLDTKQVDYLIEEE